MNWGWRITIFLTLFIGFIMSMVIYSFSTTNDLVSEDYYNQEILYQQNIDAQKNALSLAHEATLTIDNEVVILTFPSNFNQVIEKGNITFYRPDNAKLDKSFDLNLNNLNKQVINRTEIARGFYKVTVQFVSDNKTYLFNKEIKL